MSPPPTPPANTLAITDTNVSLDIHSCHDLVVTQNELYRKFGDAALDDSRLVYRRQRARESALLAMCFHQLGATTFGLHHEPVDLLVRRAPPAPGGMTMESDFATFFVHFVKDYLLADWDERVPTEPGNEAKNEADLAYIAIAKAHGLPLITNEGYTQDGLVDFKKSGEPTLRKLAKDQGVEVFCPREFYAGKIDEAQEIAGFLTRFREQAPRYLAARGRSDDGYRVLMWIEGYYRMILLGEVEGRASPLRVSLQR